MCGFLFSCSRKEQVKPDEPLLELLRKRGPDGCQTLRRTMDYRSSLSSLTDKDLSVRLHLSFSSTVLSLRGQGIVIQPLVDEISGSLLCWNGEAWKVDRQVVSGNDTEQVFKSLIACVSRPIDEYVSLVEARESSSQAIKRALGRLNGPFSFLFYDARYERLFYGRDILGRRSLLVQNEGEMLRISSVADGSTSGIWQEVDASGVHELTISALSSTTSSDPKTFPSYFHRNTGLCHSMSHWSAIRKGFPDINRENIAGHNSPSCLNATVINDLYKELRSSLELRLIDMAIPRFDPQQPPRLAILFSGGLDCSVLARLCHDVLPSQESIDLLNVAFENPRVLAAANARAPTGSSSRLHSYQSCPDRMTGISTYSELLRVCPGREWNFVAIDIPYREMEAHRDQVVSLMYPHNTEMDLSISLALYFASRGQGRVKGTHNSKSYTSTARVLLSGLGADELFGGYARHEIAYSRGGQDALLAELELDFTRIGKRNLGRDDRIISHWGKEVRYPYLDEDLVSWILTRPVWEKCGFLLQPRTLAGAPINEVAHKADKILLRLLARNMGMNSAAGEKKRAIQFGARTAKMLAGNTKGTQAIS